MTNSNQNEVFIINDIDLKINPSDVQLMDDNWVMEDSYLRSKAVFCYRSKYSATKIAINIPFQISGLDGSQQDTINNTFNCIKLITQLNSYPFCFIKSQRLKSYISPTKLSETGFLVFAVDEISLVQDSSASNVVFLEVVLQYFNYTPLIKDFEFKSNLDTTIVDQIVNEFGEKMSSGSNMLVDGIAPDIVGSLKDSEVWQRYMRPKIRKVFETLTDKGLLNQVNADTRSTHPMMGVKILAPIMSEINQRLENVDDGRLIGPDTKVISVTDIAGYDNGSLENILSTLLDQNYSDSRYTNEAVSGFIKTEGVIKKGQLTTSDEKDLTVGNIVNKAANGVISPFISEGKSGQKPEESLYRKNSLNKAIEDQEKANEGKKIEDEKATRDPSLGTARKDVFIQWVGKNISELEMGIQVIKVTRKNKLATHQISAYKHPIVQYLGKYPVTATVSMSSVNYEVYKTEELPVYNLITQIFNLLDYNRAVIPEAEAYNYLKIYSLSSILLDCTSFVPSQSSISASAANQGVENIVYSFNESDLTSFIEQSVVQDSGKMATNKVDVQSIDIVLKWLNGFAPIMQDILNGNAKGDAVNTAHSVETYKLITQLATEAMVEMGLTKLDHYKAMATASKLADEIKANNNIKVKLVKVVSDTPKEFARYNLYKELEAVNVAAGTGNSVDYQKAVAQQNKNYKEADTTSLYNVNLGLIPFMAYVLKTRQNIIKGGSTTIPNLTFTPSGRYNVLLNSVLSKLSIGLEQGETVAVAQLSDEVSKDFLVKTSASFINKFFGYNIEDLSLEDLSPITYNRETDQLIQSVDPFFFIEEKKHLDGTEMVNMYENMFNQDSGELEDVTDLVNQDTNDSRDEADATAQIIGLDYRKLQEINYTPPIQLTSTTGGEFDSYMNVMGGGEKKTTTKGAKDIPKPIVDAIEKALAKYGLSGDKNFRDYMYSVLLIESTNGSNLSSKTKAQGIFQFTGYGIREVLEMNNKAEYSSGGALYRSLTRSQSIQRTEEIRKKLYSDHYLSAQMFIEKTRNGSGSDVNINGAMSPLYSFIKYNIGLGGLTDVRAVLEKGKRTILSETRENIRTQSPKFVDPSSDVKTINNYVNSLISKLSVDNVPDSVAGNVKAPDTKVKTVDTIRDISQAIVNKTPNNLFSPKTTATPLIYQKAVIDKASAAYNGVKASKADKVYNSSFGVAMKGKIIDVEDGDTATFVDSKTNKKYQLRIYGMDAPEVVHKNGTGKTEVYGPQAKSAMTDLVLNKDVTIQMNGLDAYKRHISQITLADGSNPALTMVRNGYAFMSQGLTSEASYAKAEAEATKAGKGIWSFPPGVVARPRSDGQDIIAKHAAANPNAPNYQKFTSSDLTYAASPKSKPLNNYQPFAGGKTFTVTSPFGMRPDPKNPKRIKMHEGVDFGCPVGTKVVAASSGKVTNRVDSNNVNVGYGKYVTVDHGNGFISLYAHLSEHSVANGAHVKAGDVVGISGNTGRSTGPHLHYGVKYNGKFINPFGTKVLSQFKPGDIVGSGINTVGSISTVGDQLEKVIMNREGITKENTVYNEDELAKLIFKRMTDHVNIGLKTALPSIKVYVTVGNENDKFWLDTLKGSVQYYELKGIKSFKMNCNNDGNPIDTVILTIANPSFLNNDSFMGLSKIQGVNVNAIGTGYETQFINNRLQIKAGTKLHIRVGYGNNPNDLDVLFNGAVSDVSEGQQSLSIICEGFGKELLGEIFAPSKPMFLNKQNDNINTATVIGSSLISRAIDHFGYNSGFWADKFRESTDPEDRSLAPEGFSFSYNLFFDFTPAKYKSRLFTNVFAPEIEAVDNTYNNYSGWISNLMNLGANTKGGYPFAIYKMTAWDCIKQMEYRHPNTITRVKMYEDRVTLFYGVKEQTCFTKDLPKSLQMSAASKKEDGESGYDLSGYYNKRRERMTPACDMHIITSNTNLISNGLSLNSNYSSVTNVNYYVEEDAALSAKPWELESLKMQLDDNLYPFEIREKELTMSGCIGRYSAFLYGTTDLKKEAEKMYSGKIIITGNPTMKAGDYAFIDDSEKRIHGLVLIRECYHSFDSNNGFITEIVPGQYVEAANFMYSSLWLKLMCCTKVATTKLKTTLSDNFSDKSFNMVTDYLTIMNQIEIAFDKFEKGYPADTAGYYTNGTMVALSAYLINSMYGSLGISNKAFNIGRGIGRFTKHFRDIYTTKIDKVVSGFIKSGIKMWADDSKLVQSSNNAITKGKAFIGGTKFAEKYQKAKALKSKSGLVWRASSFVVSHGSKAAVTGMRILGRTLLTSVLAFAFSNPLSILLDLALIFAIRWATNKIEEEQLTRQPLLFFPLVKNGKPYSGGMAGVIRNTWTASKLLEGQKTFNEIQKAAQILEGNAKVAGKSDSMYASILRSVAGDYEGKNVAPLYENDSSGNQLTVESKKVLTKQEAVARAKALTTYKQTDEEMKQLLIQKLNTGSVNSDLEVRGF